MDRGTLHLLCNLHHVVGGTVDLDSMVRNLLEEENRKEEPQRKLIRVRHPFDYANTGTNMQACSSNKDNMASMGLIDQKNSPGTDDNPSRSKDPMDQIPQSSSNVMDQSPWSNITTNVSKSEEEQRVSPSTKDMTQSVTSDIIGQNVRHERCQNAEYSLLNKIKKSVDFDRLSGTDVHANVKIARNVSQGPDDKRTDTEPIPSTSGLQNAQVLSANYEMAKRRETHFGTTNSYAYDQREPMVYLNDKQSIQMDLTQKQDVQMGLTQQQGAQIGLTQQQDTSALEAIIDRLVRAQACFDEPLGGELSTGLIGGDLPTEPHPCGLQGNQQTGQQSHEAKGSTVSVKQALMQLVGQKIQQIIKFAKAIPEFSNLSMSDRLSLIKASKSEGSTIGSAVVDVKNKRVLAERRVLNFSEMETCIPRAYMEKRVQIAADLDALKLSAREAAVLRAMVITYPDRCELEEEGRVKNIHANMISCLYHVLHEERCPDVPQRLENIHRVLASLRSMTESHSNILEQVFQKWSELDDFEIVREFLNL